MTSQQQGNTMTSQPQLEHYFSHLNMSGCESQAELRLIADDASIPTQAQMRRALRSTRRGSSSNQYTSLDRRSYHTPSCLKDSGQKGLMRWDASSSSSSSLALSTLSRNKSNTHRSLSSSDCLLVLPQRRWKDLPATSGSDTRSRSDGYKDSSKLPTIDSMRNPHHNSLFEESTRTTRNWQASSRTESSSPSSLPLNKAPSKLYQEDYLVSVLASLAHAESCSSAVDGHNQTATTSTPHSPTPTNIISRALDISRTSPCRNTTDVTSVTRRKSVDC